jgi:hypothetical protein
MEVSSIFRARDAPISNSGVRQGSRGLLRSPSGDNVDGLVLPRLQWFSQNIALYLNKTRNKNIRREKSCCFRAVTSDNHSNFNDVSVLFLKNTEMGYSVRFAIHRS